MPAQHTSPVQGFSAHQHTLCYSMTCAGVGIHNGQSVVMTFHPAPVGTGVVFRRIDLQGLPTLPATHAYRVDTPQCTKISVVHEGKSVNVTTIEHVMAALAAFEIDNVRIDITGEEVPIMDGSSAPFVALLQCAGKVAQPALRQYIQITQTIEVVQGDKSCSLSPANALTISYTALSHNADPLIDGQRYTYVHTWGGFRQDVAAARTVGFYDQIQQLQAQGLGLGGSLDNTVVLRQGEVLNPGGLRYTDEFARHKVLDALGDLYLAGHPIVGAFHSLGGGHSLNGAVVTALKANPAAWRFITLPNKPTTSTAMEKSLTFPFISPSEVKTTPRV